LVQKTRAAEPVHVVAEAVHAVLAGERRLPRAHARVGEVVIAELARKLRLLVPREVGLRAAHVRPFGEAFAPPAVVLRNAMELREIEGDDAHVGRVDRPALVTRRAALLDLALDLR